MVFGHALAVRWASGTSTQSGQQSTLAPCETHQIYVGNLPYEVDDATLLRYYFQSVSFILLYLNLHFAVFLAPFRPLNHVLKLVSFAIKKAPLNATDSLDFVSSMTQNRSLRFSLNFLLFV